MRQHDLCYMTSSSTGSPFSTSSVTGYNDFQDFYAQNETFTASFKDGSNHYMVAICSLNGSNNVVVDQILMSSAGPTTLSEPTFSGTVDIVIGASSINTTQMRYKNCSSDQASHNWHRHMNGYLFTGNQNSAYTNDQLYLFPHWVTVPGWYYGFHTQERTCTAADYRICLFDVNEAGHPDQILMETPSTTHSGGANVDAELDLDNTLTITAITVPGAQVTYTGTDPTAGDRIYITGANNVTNVNNTSFLVTNVNTGANTFDLQDMTGAAYTTTGTAATTGTVHFPVYLSAGDYITGFVCDTNALNFNGPVVADELSMPSSFGQFTGISNVVRLNKSYTYAAHTAAPDMSTGWTDSISDFIAIALLAVDG
jgi:hypothetical protein